MKVSSYLVAAVRVAEYPVDVYLAMTEVERRPDTPPLWARHDIMQHYYSLQ